MVCAGDKAFSLITEYWRSVANWCTIIDFLWFPLLFSTKPSKKQGQCASKGQCVCMVLYECTVLYCTTLGCCARVDLP